MSTAAAQPQFTYAPNVGYSAPAVTQAPTMTYAYQQVPGGVPMEPMATPGPMPVMQSVAQAQQPVVTYQTAAGSSSNVQVYSQGQSVSYVQQLGQEIAGQSVTYVQAPQEGVQAQQVTYVQPAQAQEVNSITYGAPSVMQAQAPTYMVQQGAVVQQGAATYSQFPSAPSMVAYPSAVSGAGYFPLSVQQAWDNYTAAWKAKDMDRVMLDYDESSVVRVYDIVKDQFKEYRGLGQIRELFTGHGDLSSREAIVNHVDEEFKEVFMVWRCPARKIDISSDTFIFGPDFKIKRQNSCLHGKEGFIAALTGHSAHHGHTITQPTAAPTASMGAGAAAAGVAAGAATASMGSMGSMEASPPQSSISSAKASKKSSKKKLSSKKKKGGIC